MITTESSLEFFEPPTLPAIVGLFVEQTQKILDTTNAFRRWTRQNLILRQPDAASLKQHDQVCKWLIRLLRLIQFASEPEFSDKKLVSEVDFLVKRLTEDWEMLHNAMPEAEAKKFIPELFAA